MFVDLSEQDLKERFLRAYKAGQTFMCDNEVVDAKQIQRVRIVETAKTSGVELEQIEKKSEREREHMNRSSSFVVMGPLFIEKEDIVSAGTEVTSRYIDGPPGRGDKWAVVGAFMNHPWISTIGAGLILAALLVWLKWN